MVLLSNCLILYCLILHCEFPTDVIRFNNDVFIISCIQVDIIILYTRILLWLHPKTTRRVGRLIRKLYTLVLRSSICRVLVVFARGGGICLTETDKGIEYIYIYMYLN